MKTAVCTKFLFYFLLCFNSCGVISDDNFEEIRNKIDRTNEYLSEILNAKILKNPGAFYSKVVKFRSMNFTPFLINYVKMKIDPMKNRTCSVLILRF